MSNQAFSPAVNANPGELLPENLEASALADQRVLLTDLPPEILMRICSYLVKEHSLVLSEDSNQDAQPASLVNRKLRAAAVPTLFEEIMLFNRYAADLHRLEGTLKRLLALPVVLGAIRTLRINFHTFCKTDAEHQRIASNESNQLGSLRQQTISTAEHFKSLLYAVSPRLKSLYIICRTDYGLMYDFYNVLTGTDITFQSLRELQVDAIGPIDFIIKSPFLKSYQFGLGTSRLNDHVHERCARIFAMLKQIPSLESLCLMSAVDRQIVHELGASKLGVTSLSCDMNALKCPHCTFHVPLSDWVDAWSRLPRLQHLVMPKGLTLVSTGFRPSGIPENLHDPNSRIFRRKIYGEVLRTIYLAASRAFGAIPTLETINRDKDTLNDKKPYTREWIKGFAAEVERECTRDNLTEPWKAWAPEMKCDGSTQACFEGSCLSEDCFWLTHTLGNASSLEHRLFWWI